jgi:MFS family permease
MLSTVLTMLQGAALIAVGNAFSTIAIFAAVVVLGISVGNLLMLQPLLLAEAFGVAEYSRIYSFNQLFSTLGVAGGPVILGVVHDALDYRTAFVLAGAASLLGFLALVSAGSSARPLEVWDRRPVPAAS